MRFDVKLIQETTNVARDEAVLKTIHKRLVEEAETGKYTLTLPVVAGSILTEVETCLVVEMDVERLHRITLKLESMGFEVLYTKDVEDEDGALIDTLRISFENAVKDEAEILKEYVESIEFQNESVGELTNLIRFEISRAAFKGKTRFVFDASNHPKYLLDEAMKVIHDAGFDVKKNKKHQIVVRW